VPEHFDKESLLRDLASIPIVSSPLIAPGTFYLMPEPMALQYDAPTFRFYETPWSPAPEHWTPAAKTGRERALDHLARLLDGWCEETTLHGEPLDPDKVWRGPRIRERDQRRYIVEAYVGYHINEPQACLRIVGSV